MASCRLYAGAGRKSKSLGTDLKGHWRRFSVHFFLHNYVQKDDIQLGESIQVTLKIFDIKFLPHYNRGLIIGAGRGRPERG